MIGKRIKHFRELNNYGREWLAEQIGISPEQLNRIENNVSEITVERLVTIAQIFKISPIDLFEEQHLQVNNVKDYDKYGPIESSFIKYVIWQQEILRAENVALTTRYSEVMGMLGKMQNNLESCINFMIEHISKLNNTKTEVKSKVKSPRKKSNTARKK